jgi:phosphoribosylaminoimidazolecarboxamide formyltransferase/IMP cyclohydrolase
MSDRLPIRRALVSVFDKSGLDGLARALAAAGVEVVSTGSTAAALEGHGLGVTRVEELTGFGELLDGRVKTLHPGVHAGLLADRSVPGHRAELEAAGIAPFDLVVVNLYPFEETVADPGVEPSLATERIDVGGPAVGRARRQEPRLGGRGLRPGRLPAGRAGPGRRRHHPGRAARAGRQGVRPHRRLRRRRGRLDGGGRGVR